MADVVFDPATLAAIQDVLSKTALHVQRYDPVVLEISPQRLHQLVAIFGEVTPTGALRLSSRDMLDAALITALAEGMAEDIDFGRSEEELMALTAVIDGMKQRHFPRPAATLRMMN